MANLTALPTPVEQVRPLLERLEIDPLFIAALLEVEAPNGGFLPGGHPTVLYERHKFHRLTGGRFSEDHPDLSNPVPTWVDGSYGTRSRQVLRLAQASLLDCAAAHKACSWGSLQLLGQNFRLAGCDSLWQFVAAMHESEASQLRLALAFLESDPRKLVAAQREDIERFSRLWNGPAYRKTGHHLKLREALHGLRQSQTQKGSS